MRGDEKPETISETRTSGDQAPAASASHSGTGDINIDQSVHHLHPPSEVLTFQEERLISKSPEELLEYFQTHTSIQAERLVEPFVGKPIRAGGAVENIVAVENGVLVLLMMPHGDLIQANFALSWKVRLSEPSKGDPLDLVGRLGSLGVGGFSLSECQLIGERGLEQISS